MTKQHPTFLSGPRHAEIYAAMEHDPFDPRVRKSYAALTDAIVGQWNGLLAAGFEFVASADDPYDSSDAMLRDAERNRRIAVFTDGGASLPSDHPMRKLAVLRGAPTSHDMGFRTLNDVFRGVHDVMGHYAAHRAGKVASFGPVGEYNAWQQHRHTLPATAHMALWCETRGQNAYTNFWGDHASLPIADRPYVDQRAGVPSARVW